MNRNSIKIILLTIGNNILFSWLILPFLIPPFQAYKLRQLFEVALWQGISMIGWPVALVGLVASFLFKGGSSDPGSILIYLFYPVIFLLLIISLRANKLRWELLIPLNVLLTLTFLFLWIQVINGYEFMLG